MFSMMVLRVFSASDNHAIRVALYDAESDMELRNKFESIVTRCCLPSWQGFTVVDHAPEYQ